MDRIGEVKRQTRETDISCRVELDNPGRIKVDTDIAFLSHMLELFARFANISLALEARGDVQIDIHHLNEDIGIVLGQCIANTLGDKVGIRRVASAYMPMDEAMARAVVDISGRPYLAFNVFVAGVDNSIQAYSFDYARQFFLALANHLKANIHIDLLRGRDFHHCMEAIFKAFGMALRDAVRIEGKDIPSTKGILD